MACVISWGNPPNTPEVAFTSPATQDGVFQAAEGHTTLRWSVAQGDADAWDYELEQFQRERAPQTRTFYSGPDRASFVSGLPEGEHHYRVRAISKDSSLKGEWSEPIMLSVKYVDFTKVEILMGVGALTFIATVIIILVGALRTRQETN